MFQKLIDLLKKNAVIIIFSIAILVLTTLSVKANNNPLTLDNNFTVTFNFTRDEGDYLLNYNTAKAYYNANCNGQKYIIGSFGNGYGSNEVDLICLGNDDLDFDIQYHRSGSNFFYRYEYKFKNSYRIHTFYNSGKYTYDNVGINDRYWYVNNQNVPANTVNFDIETNAIFKLADLSFRNSSSWYSEGYFPITKNGTTYNLGDTILNSDGSFYSPNIDIPTNDNIKTQLFSVDNVIQDTLPHDFKFSFYVDEIKPLDGFDKLDSFTVYSLYNNNGLYTWKETDNCLVYGDYNEKLSGNKYTINVDDVTCDFSDGSIQHYFKINLKNTYNYAYFETEKAMPISYLNTISYRHIIEMFNTSNFEYINFSTSKAKWNYNDYFYITSKDIYIDYFNFDTKKHSEYAIYTTKNEKGYMYQLNFGQTDKTGFWLTYNICSGSDLINTIFKNNFALGFYATLSATTGIENLNDLLYEKNILNEDFKFLFSYVPDNLYFAINSGDGSRLNHDTKRVDENGDPIDVDLDPSDDISIVDTRNLTQKLEQFIADLEETFAYINAIYTSFYIMLGDFKFLHDLIFHIIMIIILAKVVSS